MKTSLAPGSTVVTDYLERAGLDEYLDKLGFNLVGYGCTTCIGNSGPLPEEISAAVNENDLVVCAVLSGNRNFEGRINQDVRNNYLASPPLVRRLRARRADGHRPAQRAARRGRRRRARSTCATSGRARRRSRQTVADAVRPEMFEQQLRRRLHRRRALARARDARGRPLHLARLDLRPQALVLRGHGRRAGARSSRSPAPGCSPCSATSSPPTTSRPPARSRRTARPARWLIDNGVEPRDFNSYGSRRGNHEVMIRGTFANIRLRNQLVEREGGFTRHFPDGEETTIYEAAMAYADEGVPLVVLAGKEYGSGSSRDWAAKGTRAARRPRGDRRELRAHPPLEPDRDGRAAAAVPDGRDGAVARARPARRRSTSATSTSGEAKTVDGRPRDAARAPSRSSSRRRSASTPRTRSATSRTAASSTASCATCAEPATTA